jgi:hypothetical protein
MAREGAEAVVVQGIFFSRTVADLAIAYRLPSASVLRQFAQAGGLMSDPLAIPRGGKALRARGPRFLMLHTRQFSHSQWKPSQPNRPSSAASGFITAEFGSRSQSQK